MHFSWHYPCVCFFNPFPYWQLMIKSMGSVGWHKWDDLSGPAHRKHSINNGGLILIPLWCIYCLALFLLLVLSVFASCNLKLCRDNYLELLCPFDELTPFSLWNDMLYLWQKLVSINKNFWKVLKYLLKLRYTVKLDFIFQL